MRRIGTALALFAVIVVASRSAHAWLFEEHANVGRLALVSLSAAERQTLDDLWRAAREEDRVSQARLCTKAERPWTHDRVDEADSQCVDFAALAAVAGDHSCSPDEMWKTVVHSDWFPKVYLDAAETEKRLGDPDASAYNKVDAWHLSNLRLQDFDAQYLTRAANNNAHFVRARKSQAGVDEFLVSAAAVSSAVNATETYAVYHLAALAAAAKLARSPVGAKERGKLALAVVEAETFALHFLEDSFSAGHFVGFDPFASGTLTERAGTHDYYCQYGLEARPWGLPRGFLTGDGAPPVPAPYGAHGDAFQTDPATQTVGSDLAMAAAAAAASLRQVLDVAGGSVPLDPSVDADADTLASNGLCAQVYVDRQQSSVVLRAARVLVPILALTPQPYPEEPALPHFRSEFGLSLRTSGAGRIGEAFGGNYDPTAPSGPRLQTAIDIGAGFGLGAEGLTSRSTDGIFFLQGDAIAYGPEEYPTPNCTHCTTAPIRFGWGGRLRAPFFVVPGDTILAALLVLPFSWDTWLKLAVPAAEGSIWGRFERVWSGPLSLPFSLQFVVGREAGLYYSAQNYFKMTELELPLVELRSKHEFSDRIAGDTLLQLGGALEWSTLTFGSTSRDTFSYALLARGAFDGLFYAYP